MLLGIDCGSTAVKAVLFDADGTTVATGTRRTEPVQPAPSHVEQDMDRLWELTCAAVADALHAAPSGARAVEAIGVTAHGDGVYLSDVAGRPLGRGIASTDSRARGVTAVWAERGVLDRVETIAGQRPYPYAASTLLLAWIERNEPARFAAIGHVLFCKDWLRYRLTGVIATDPTDASTAFTEARTQRYSSDLLAVLGLEAVAPALPEILPSSGIVGTVSPEAAAQTGLLAGTPVAGGMHDVTASSVGLGNLQPGVVSITAGTFSINETLSDHLAVDRRWTARAGLRPGQWMNMSISPASSNNVDWFLRQAYRAEWDGATSGSSLWDTVEADLAVPAASDAPLFHPFLYGSPYEGPASASFFGLRSWHDRADMLRAVVEGAVFNHRFHVDALRSAFPAARARITGGGTSRPRSARLFADALGVPIEVPEATEIGALGAALLAGVGVGVYASLGDAVGRACRVAARFEPDHAHHAALTERYARYVALAEAVLPLSPGAAPLDGARAVGTPA